MKFNAEKQRAYLSLSDYINSSERVYHPDSPEFDATGFMEWQNKLEQEYQALPDIEVGYDSSLDTLRHIRHVSILLTEFATKLLYRANVHDTTKFTELEKPLFDKETPKLAKISFGTPEYYESIRALGPALQHHYAHNSHHPEYYENGIEGMDLLDIVEMLLDWTASSRRHDDGTIYKSIDINASRYGITEQLAQIFRNTIATIERRNIQILTNKKTDESVDVSRKIKQ